MTAPGEPKTPFGVSGSPPADGRGPVTLLSGARSYLPGLALAAGLAALCVQSDRLDWLRAQGISVLTLAIVLGILVGNTVYSRIAPATAAGVTLSKQKLLRLGIILYGFRLTFQEVAQVGFAGVVIDAIVLGTTFVLAWQLGTRFLKLDRETAILIGAGSAVCGAAAVMAAESVVRGRAEQVTVAVSTVVVFGTLAMFLYPALYHFNLRWQLLPISSATFGIYIGATVHEVAQVAAAALSVSSSVADTAVITKMVRVMMLAPFLILLSAFLSRADSRASTAAPGEGRRPRLPVPWFALGFVLIVGFNSLKLLPQAVVNVIVAADTFLLATAMVSLGLTTHLSAIRWAGIKPLMLAALLFGWLIFGGLAITLTVRAWIG